MLRSGGGRMWRAYFRKSGGVPGEENEKVEIVGERGRRKDGM